MRTVVAQDWNWTDVRRQESLFYIPKLESAGEPIDRDHWVGPMLLQHPCPLVVSGHCELCYWELFSQSKVGNAPQKRVFSLDANWKFNKFPSRWYFRCALRVASIKQKGGQNLNVNHASHLFLYWRYILLPYVKKKRSKKCIAFSTITLLPFQKQSRLLTHDKAVLNLSNCIDQIGITLDFR